MVKETKKAFIWCQFRHLQSCQKTNIENINLSVSPSLLINRDVINIYNKKNKFTSRINTFFLFLFFLYMNMSILQNPIALWEIKILLQKEDVSQCYNKALEFQNVSGQRDKIS